MTRTIFHQDKTELKFEFPEIWRTVTSLQYCGKEY